MKKVTKNEFIGFINEQPNIKMVSGMTKDGFLRTYTKNNEIIATWLQSSAGDICEVATKQKGYKI